MTYEKSNENRFDKSCRILFAIIVVLVTFAALIGWLNHSVYSNNHTDLIIKLRYYDLSLLVIVIPISLAALILSFKNNPRAIIFTIGLAVYLIFSYSVTIFTSAQNDFFLIYIAILSLCAFYIAKGYAAYYNSRSFELDRKTAKVVAIVLLFSAIMGFGNWFSEAINTLLMENGKLGNLQVKAPQVFDLAFIIPCTIYGAIRLWKNKKDGVLIAAIMIVFFIFISLSVLIMELGLATKINFEMDYVKVISFLVISLINIFIAILAFGKLEIS